MACTSGAQFSFAAVAASCPAAWWGRGRASAGQPGAHRDVQLILAAMKMETDIRAAQAGTGRGIAVKSGDAVSVGDTLMTLA